jgi:hypothetical protein
MTVLLASARALAAGRMGVAALQGGALWFLREAAASQSWPATDNAAFNLLLAVALFVPFVAIAGLGNLRPTTLIAWVAIAAVLCAGLGFHAGNREASPDLRHSLFDDWLPFVGALGGLLFIAHALVAAGDSDRRWIARFPTYFDVAWRDATELALAALFVGVFWIVLELGAWLFRVIGIQVFTTTIEKDWFWIPATTLAASGAIHLVDSRTAMVRGSRTLVLGMLSWLMPVLVVIGMAFLAALPFTGLTPLWKTGHATASLLAAAILLILLINSHFQDGGPESNQAGLLLYARAAGAAMLAPLVGLAAVGLALRVEQYGWSASRIVALAVVIAVAWHAAGYLLAVVRSGAALRDLPITNVLSAIGIMALMIALLTPLADPARLSVASQVGRLEAGRVAPERFDFNFLEQRSGRYGIKALERLKTSAQGPNAAEIERLAKSSSGRIEPPPRANAETRRTNIRMMRPGAAALPAEFLQGAWNDMQESYRLPSCLTLANLPCDALVLDLAGNDSTQIVLFDGMKASVFAKDANGKWALVGEVGNLHCPGVVEAIRAGKFETAPSTFKDIQANGSRLPIIPFCQTP